MNYNHALPAPVALANSNGLTQVLKDHFKLLFADKTDVQGHDDQPEKNHSVSNRTSEDERLEFLGYNY